MSFLRIAIVLGRKPSSNLNESIRVRAMTIRRRSIGAAAKAEEKVMNLRTKLAITGLGVAVLMLLAFLTPVDAMAQIA